MKLMLKEIRKSKGLSQQQLAKLACVTQGSIHQWESGMCFPSLQTFCRLCDVLACAPSDLLRPPFHSPAAKA